MANMKLFRRWLHLLDEGWIAGLYRTDESTPICRCLLSGMKSYLIKVKRHRNRVEFSCFEEIQRGRAEEIALLEAKYGAFPVNFQELLFAGVRPVVKKTRRSA